MLVNNGGTAIDVWLESADSLLDEIDGQPAVGAGAGKTEDDGDADELVTEAKLWGKFAVGRGLELHILKHWVVDEQLVLVFEYNTATSRYGRGLIMTVDQLIWLLQELVGLIRYLSPGGNPFQGRLF